MKGRGKQSIEEERRDKIIKKKKERREGKKVKDVRSGRGENQGKEYYKKNTNIETEDKSRGRKISRKKEEGKKK